MADNSQWQEISEKGLWSNNPALVQLLGLCPLLAVSGSVVNALGLGLATMLVLAGAFGAVSGVTGAVISVQGERLPTGPMIILVLTAIVIVSVAFAPRHGVVPERVRHWRNRRALVAPDRPGTPLPEGDVR